MTGKYQQSSRRIFKGSELERTLKSIEPYRDEHTVKKVAINSAKFTAITLYKLTEVLARGSEILLRGLGKTSEYLGGRIDDNLQWIEPKTHKSVPRIQKVSHEARNIYINTKKSFQSYFSERTRDKAMVSLALLVGLIGGYQLLPNSLPTKQESENKTYSAPMNLSTREPIAQELLEPSITPPSQPITRPGIEETITSNAQPPSQEELQEIPVNNLSQFNDRNVLIYCANNDERISVRDTLRSRGVRLHRTHNGSYKTRLRGSNIDVVVRGSGIPRKHYGVIQLRGHTTDMVPLAQETEHKGRRNHILLLGGCNSNIYIDDLAKKNKAVIASTGIQDSSQNTYLLNQVLKQIGRAHSWEELSRNIKNNSQRAQFNTTFPSDQNYVR